jgi:anti-sigma-K factor RskA
MRADPELIDRLAAEYALGTLRGRPRERFQRWMATMPVAAAAVRAWEDRLVGLVAGTTPIQPAPRAWRELELRLGLRTARSPWWRRGSLQSLAAAIAVLGVALLITMLAREPSVQWQPVATLATENAPRPAWRIEVSLDGALLRAVPVQPLPAGPAQSYELWALPQTGNPVSLGVLPREDATSIELTDMQRLALAAAANLAVSREPAGGSPTGLPTGDVVIVAKPERQG